MTICIAAPCLNKGEPRIVLAADRMIANEDASGEIEFKFEHLLPSSLLALYSGPQSQALGLIYSYRLGLKKTKVSVENLPNVLTEVLRKRQQTIVDMAVGMKLGGISFQEFVAAGGRLDKGIGAKIVKDVDAAKLTVELIVTGFLLEATSGQVKPIITKVTDKGVETHKNFLCIGVGTVPAEHVLYRREQSELVDLDRTIYNLFEAKKMAEIAQGVGQETVMAVMKPIRRGKTVGFSFSIFKYQTLNWLFERYIEYGPKNMFGLTIPDEYRSWD